MPPSHLYSPRELFARHCLSRESCFSLNWAHRSAGLSGAPAHHRGKVAAGGNITMTDFAVGSGLPASNISNTLVAGGNLSLSRGALWGDTFYGGSLSADQSVTQMRGTRAQGTPINFAARFAELRDLSSQLASMTATGTTRRESWGGLSMNGTSANVNVFDVSASAFTGAVYWQINAPAGSLVVVNIRGASAS